MRRLLALCAVLLVAADWPQWLGPNRDGSSAEVVKPWKESPKVLWRASVGEGHSSPIVADKLVFLHTLKAGGGRPSETVTAFDAMSGVEKSSWIQAHRNTDQEVPFSSPFGNGPRSTPLFRDGFLYTLGVTGELNWFAVDGGRLVHRAGRWGRILSHAITHQPLVIGAVLSQQQPWKVHRRSFHQRAA